MVIGKKDGKDYMLGSLQWEYNVDASGTLTFGGTSASEADIQTLKGSLQADYLRNTFGGTLP